MAAATASTLPLHCNICPKKPDFSDVSHLLTHIASKGHLSHYYKIKVRSSHDLVAKSIIDVYDCWYANYNVESLMSERMHQKDRKRPRTRPQVPIPSNQNMSKTTTVDPLLSEFTKSNGALEEYPALSSYPTSYPPYKPWTDNQMKTTPRVHKARLALWRTSRPRSVMSMTRNINSPSTMPSPFSGPGYGMAPQAKMVSKSTHNHSEEGDDGASEATKLKGVFWPGMDIFDAATFEMKKKRNQKKDTSVAIQLERHSLFVEPTEMIFTPLGSLKKERVISGHADFDSSPDKLSPPTPKPKRRQPGRQPGRPPLATKDGNVSSQPFENAPPPPFPGYGPVNNSVSATRQSQPVKKEKRTFEVFEDNNRRQMDDATAMRYLNSGFRPATHADPVRRPLPPTLVDINTGAMYHNNVFAEAFEPFQPSFYGMPYYGHGYYGHTGMTYPGLFSSLHTHLSAHHESSNGNSSKVEDCDDARTVSAHSDR